MLTTREVARRLNCSIGCVYTLIQQGLLAHTRIGVGRGVIRVDESDLDDYIEQQTKRTRKVADDSPPKHDLKQFASRRVDVGADEVA